MKRKLFCGLLTAALLMQPAFSARRVQVQVDGDLLSTHSYVEQGVTYVPLRSLLDAFDGWEIRWDAERRSAVAVSGSSTIIADPASDVIQVNDSSLSGRVTVENGRTYVPLRLITEALGGTAQWDGYLDGAAVTSPGASYNAVDLYWLSRIISAESQGEPLTGQIAVGNVVMNRVASDEFPNTISGVVFDRKNGVQFEPVSNGTVFLSPTAQSVAAAKQVLDGQVVLEDALYFYAPALSQGVWINANRVYNTTIGCHRFYL